jgi:hypothetical protein
MPWSDEKVKFTKSVSKLLDYLRQPKDSQEEDSPYAVFTSFIAIVVAVIAVVLGLLAARAKVLHY